MPKTANNGHSEPESFASLAGVWSGQVQTADDFDELPEDLAESLGS